MYRLYHFKGGCFGSSGVVADPLVRTSAEALPDTSKVWDSLQGDPDGDSDDQAQESDQESGDDHAEGSGGGDDSDDDGQSNDDDESDGSQKALTIAGSRSVRLGNATTPPPNRKARSVMSGMARKSDGVSPSGMASTAGSGGDIDDEALLHGARCARQGGGSNTRAQEGVYRRSNSGTHCHIKAQCRPIGVPLKGCPSLFLGMVGVVFVWGGGGHGRSCADKFKTILCSIRMAVSALPSATQWLVGNPGHRPAMAAQRHTPPNIPRKKGNTSLEG